MKKISRYLRSVKRDAQVLRDACRKSQALPDKRLNTVYGRLLIGLACVEAAMEIGQPTQYPAFEARAHQKKSKGAHRHDLDYVLNCIKMCAMEGRGFLNRRGCGYILATPVLAALRSLGYEVRNHNTGARGYEVEW